MRINNRILLSTAASLSISAVILLLVWSILWDIKREADRAAVYGQIGNETTALSLLVTGFPSLPDAGHIRQVKSVRASLEKLLGKLQSQDAREASLIRQIRSNAVALGNSLEKLIAGAGEQAEAASAELREMLTSQLRIKAQLISDDTNRLMKISRSRIDAAQQQAAILILALIVALILINAAISIFSSRRILRVQKALRQLNESLEQQVAERTKLAEARAKQLQSLAVELIDAEERVKERISKLLHDDLQQILAAARYQVQMLYPQLPQSSELCDVEQMLSSAIEKSRRLSHELSPAILHHSGLVPALEWLAQQMRERFGLEVRVLAEPAQELESPSLKVFLFRAAQELLFNVVKYAGVHSAQVILAGCDFGLSVTVSDQGAGFEPTLLERSDPRTGLGLLSLRERARYIGGSLSIESAPQQGSRITITVPVTIIRETPRPLEAAIPPDPAVKGAKSPKGQNIRVMLVDDHKVMRQGLTRLISGQPDIQVVGEAGNGREAVALARQLNPDVIVMDISMPEMNGIEATGLITAEHPHVRVIGLSMFEDEQAALAMRQAGAEAFVNKAASASQLLQAIYGDDPKIRRGQITPR
jgi:signal transduction histidine kinase/ActR/RegA family two-component response regulator